MNAFSWHDFRQKAAQAPKKILLADGEDPRVIKAAAFVHSEKIAQPILIGSPAKIKPIWKQYIESSLEPPCLDVQSLSSEAKDRLIQTLSGISKYKALNLTEASSLLQDTLILGCLQLKLGVAEGFVGGATRTTADTLRAAFSIIGLAPRVSTLFGFFFIERRMSEGTTGPLVLLADCAVIPDPSPKQLAHIAIGSAAAYELLTGGKARIAFLSFSTHGSADHPFVEKIRQALNLAKEKTPSLQMAGEWQADAALDSFTAKIKGVGDSPMAGQANVLIVPDLNCGNIGYKMVQRLGGCRAVGPVLWGMAQPANDLSRGCTTEDVVDMIALTGIQAQTPAKSFELMGKRVS